MAEGLPSTRAQCTEPHLGLATTRQLLEELDARMDDWPQQFFAYRAVTRGSMLALFDTPAAAPLLAYRTVDSQ